MITINQTTLFGGKDVMKTKLLQDKKLLQVLMLLFMVGTGHAQTTQTYNASGTFTVPAGVTTVSVQSWGAGGAGGGNTTTADGGGGGGGGAYSIAPALAVPQGTHTVTVGTGGLGNAGAAGDAGGDSWFMNNTTVLARGGAGGNPPVSGNGGLGGAGGAATPVVAGTTKFAGGNGGTGRNSNTGHGGPGATSAGTGSNGLSGAATWSTTNAPTPVPAGAGAGASGGSATNNGTANISALGGGGGGAGDKSTSGSPNTIGGDGADGQVIISWVCPTYALTASATNNGPFCNLSASTITLRSASLPSGTYTVTYNMSGATLATGNTATMTFTAGSPGTGTFSTPTLNFGNTTITITSLSSGAGCATTIGSFNTTTVNIVAPPTSVAGTDIVGCSTTLSYNVTAGSNATNFTSILWTSSGTGTFTNANSLTLCTYTPSAADIAGGTVTITLTATGNTPCGVVTSSKFLTIYENPTAIAGPTLTTCSANGPVNITFGSSITNSSGAVWSSSGTGTFVNPTSLSTCTYEPSAADIAAGSVVLTLTANSVACGSTTATKTLSIFSSPVATAGPTINTCTTSGAINITSGSSSVGHSSIAWSSSGSGTFTNATSLTLCTYNPSPSDITAGSVILTLTAYGNPPCNPVTSTKVLAISRTMTANAGTAITTCSSSGAINISAGSSATNHTTVTWSSSGTGTFVNPNSLTTCTYAPSAADISAGNVTLTLTATNAGCANVTATKILTIRTLPTAVAGPALATCNTTGAFNITSGSSATNQTSVTWTSSGTGSFANANSLTLCTYNPSAADITAGSVTLTLTAFGNAPCANAVSTKVLTISRTMTANAGTAISTCSSAGAVNITAGSSATNHTTVTWTSSGSGSFANPNSLTACTYTPSAADISAGSVTLTLTATNAGCANATATKTLTIHTLPTAVAGPAFSTCSTAGAINITAGSSATNQTSVTWTSSGTGTFSNANSLTLCTYNPSAADITAGSVTLTLTAVGNAPCANATATKVLTISSAMTANAGTAITTCSSVGSLNITAGSNATNHTTVTWTSSGTGTFANPNSLTTCTYTPSAADITAGSVILTLTASNAGCANVTATKTLTIRTAATAAAGAAFTICYTSGAFNITAGSSASNFSSVTWTTNGTGTFANANSLTLCTYTPSAADIAAGSRTFTLTAVGNAPCANATSTKTMTIFSAPTVTSTTPGSRTGAGSVFLAATASVGTLNWYSNPTGGPILGTGTGFSTPSIAATTTFYVEAVNGTCFSSPRVAVVATVNYNEIDIQGNAISIVNGDVTPSLSDWTDFGSNNATRTFTIRNVGVSLLTVGAVTISGPHASEFTVTTPPSPTVPIGGSTTFTISFAPTAVGIRMANISIVNNDLDESPYTFDIQGTGADQEIDVQGNGISIVNGDVTPSISDWTDFSSVAGSRTYTIRNNGNVALNIGGITITGVHASDFTVTAMPASTVAALGTTTFTVSFAPSAINTRSATINIANDDADENPYIFDIQGFGIIPEIDVQGNATSIADNDTTPTVADWTDFSSTASSRTFTIFNNGNITLTLGSIVISGTNAADFTVTTPPSASVAAFSSTTFVVSFVPGALGLRTATLTFSNNDNNENPYNFNIQGTGTTREIDIEGLGLSIVNGDAVTSISDGTDFGPADINLATITRTFTIRNTGSIPLTISNPTISGLNAAEFTISANPATLIIGAGSSTTFAVTFNPNAVFTRVATINIVNNDSDENPYTFAIQGTGLLDNDSDGIENNADQDDDNDGIVDSIECGTCISDPFINGSFENPTIPAASFRILATPLVTGWQTSAEGFIEIWSSGFSSGSGGPVTAAAGNQFAELNANVPGTLYQTFCLNGAGGTINWSIKHRGRAGTDTAYVRFGPDLASANASTPVATMIDGNTAWGSYSGTYPIPLGQTTIVLAFQAGPTASGSLSVGNFIDDIQIIINQNCIDSDGDTVADITDVDSDNDGIPDIEEAGFRVYSNGTATMDKTSVATWVDANANGINDYIDAFVTAGTYVIPDADGDGVRNHLDLDSDNDTRFDVDEAGLLNGDGDINGDGRGDGPDAEGDGLLNLYDNSIVFGSTTRPYAQDSDLNGTPDFLQLDSNDDGTNDIQTGLYGSFDINGDGRIDGTGDSDVDGILNVFDTNDVVKGSPRDLDRKLYLDFDGRNDYGQDTATLPALTNETLMAWIDLNSGFSSTGVVVGQPGFQLRINNSRNLEAIVNGSTITHTGVALNRSQWVHVGAVYNGSTVRLFINGQMVQSGSASGSVPSGLLTIGRNPSAASNFFRGKIDEVRVFNVALTDLQLQRMVYQEVQNTASQVRGTIVPKDIEALPYANMLRNYRMDAYRDDIVDNFTTPGIDAGTGMRIYNHKLIAVQEAPMPFVTRTSGTFATAVNDPSRDIRGMDVTDFDYSIIQVRHNITETANSTDLGMFVDPGITITMNNDTKIQNDWYLKLDGRIDLQGRSQLVQTANSELDVTSAGSIERDQQGQSNMYNYNYWCSPVGALSTTANNTAYTVSGVMRDATNPNSIQPITWTSGYNGEATSPITLSSYWIFKFQNLSPLYANWGAVGHNGILQAAQGYTMKGTNASTLTQNYAFVGKPNNGTITSPIAGGNLNLAGNPYPSALDADAFISANTAAMTGALYFWEHYNTNTSHNLLDYQGGYAARNLVGGTPPVAPAGISGLGTSSRIPSRFIPVGQGFLVYGSATGGTLTFNNSQRTFVREDNPSSNPLFRNTNGAPIADRSFDNREDEFTDNGNFAKIRLGFNSVNGYHRQILLGFMDNLATEGFDNGYDAPQLDSQPNDLYFAIPGSKLVIQGVDAFNPNKILPLSVKNAALGNVQFTLDATENFDENQNIYIHDNLTNEYHDIRNEHFEVNLPVGTFDDRFSLRFSSTSLGTSDFELSKEVIVKFTNSNDMITITNATAEAIVEEVSLFNMLGQSIRSWDVENADQNKIQIPVSNISAGTYIVKVHTNKGDLTTKIIID